MVSFPHLGSPGAVYSCSLVGSTGGKEKKEKPVQPPLLRTGKLQYITLLIFRVLKAFYYLLNFLRNHNCPCHCACVRLCRNSETGPAAF